MTAVPHLADTAAPMDAAPPENPTAGPAAVVDTSAAGLLALLSIDYQAWQRAHLERVEKEQREERERRVARVERVAGLFCALAARRVAWRWAEEQHQKTERARVAARAR